MNFDLIKNKQTIAVFLMARALVVFGVYNFPDDKFKSVNTKDLDTKIQIETININNLTQQLSNLASVGQEIQMFDIEKQSQLLKMLTLSVARNIQISAFDENPQ